MRPESVESWTPDHEFHIDPEGKSERRTFRVVVLTLVMMVVEVVAGWVYGSMALLADGWHMGTHALALGVTLFAYVFARRHANDRRFSFGTGKVAALGGFASAVALGGVALLIGVESAERLIERPTIAFDQALLVAMIGLVVNVVSAAMLHDGRGHGHGHGHGHHDHALRAAYMHVLADALTSVLAIAALLTGKYLGWVWMDPAMGLVGMVLIARWSVGLIRDSSGVLLDYEPDETGTGEIRRALEAEPETRVCDLHVWHLAPRQRAVLVSIVTHDPKPPEHYKALVESVGPFAHVTVEVNPCEGRPCPH